MHKPHAILAGVPEPVNAGTALPREAIDAKRVQWRAGPASRGIRQSVCAKKVEHQSDNSRCNLFGVN